MGPPAAIRRRSALSTAASPPARRAAGADSTAPGFQPDPRGEVEASEHAAREGDVDEEPSDLRRRDEQRHRADELDVAAADDPMVGGDREPGKDDGREDEAEPDRGRA